jgi:hypothetical protein
MTRMASRPVLEHGRGRRNGPRRAAAHNTTDSPLGLSVTVPPGMKIR